MSGICAIAQQPGHPVDRELLQAMTASMAFRGPDGQETWVDNHVGLGHAWFRTDPFTPPVKQPATLDGKVWITADARIDDRQELTRQLTAAGRQVKPDADDAVMILHAYHAWDTACLERLLGDFCFVLWDENHQRLFFARDHFGIKPLFYAPLGSTLVVSNTLNTVRLYPGASAQLDDLAVADFLLFGSAQEPDATVWRQVRRLRAGHFITWQPDTPLCETAYWRVPTDVPLVLRKPEDQVEAFLEVFSQVIGDRVRGDRVGVELSGGMDSSSIAAMLRALEPSLGVLNVQAICGVHEQWIPDVEGHFAALVADHLKVPLNYIPAEQYPMLRRLPDCAPHPEPVDDPQPAFRDDMVRQCMPLAQTWFTGWDADSILSESIRPKLTDLLRNKRYLALLQQLTLFIWTQRRLIPWKSIFSMERSRFHQAGSGFPDWLNPDLVSSLQLKERWIERRNWKKISHPERPLAYTALHETFRDGKAFDMYDAGFTGFPVQYAHPFADVRMVTHCLGLPLQPWTTKKYILRQSMRDKLPASITNRPKTALNGDPGPCMLKRDVHLLQWSDSVSTQLGKYVTIHRNADIRRQGEAWFDARLPENVWRDTRPWILDRWLSAHHKPFIR